MAQQEARMPSAQQLFAKGLATYQKIVAANYMGHREVYDLLHLVLMEEAPSNFVFADLGCGTAAGSAAALAGTRVARYVGIDISQPSLNIAKEALSRLSCPVDLRCQDLVAAIDHWTGPLDVVWIGQSLHHLRAEDKKAFMRMVASLLSPGGLFLIWEPTCLEGEDREAWMDRFCRMRPRWSTFTDEEFAAVDSHNRASDFPETTSTWIRMARAAGFGKADELLSAPNQMTRVYRFRH
jgi:SAM-dependent methyltransferase